MSNTPGSPATEPSLVDTGVMPVLHQLFRRELRLAGGLVRAVPDRDPVRGTVVSDHLTLVLQVLHHHHGVEDDVLWPLLLERVPDELAPIVTLMETQHERVEALALEAAVLLPKLAAGAEPEQRDRLADVLDQLYAHLVEHLDDEEQRLLPIVARTLSQAEWDDLGAVARARAPKKGKVLVFGMHLHGTGPEGVVAMLGEAPAPVRWLLPRLGARAYRRHALAVHGTATP